MEESGEHSILGTGEVYLDSLMKDLREVYAGAWSRRCVCAVNWMRCVKSVWGA